MTTRLALSTNYTDTNTRQDGAKYFTASTSAHLGLDILIMALPVFQIGQLQLKRTQRWGVSLLFTFGILTCIASICLLVHLLRFCRSSSKIHMHTYAHVYTQD